MAPCPRCRMASAIYLERDLWGEWRVCLYCGWDEEFILKKPQEILPEASVKPPTKRRGREPIAHGIKL